MNIIFGSAGFAKEVDYLLSDKDENYTTDFFSGEPNGVLSIHGVPVIRDEDILDLVKNTSEPVFGYIAVGMPIIRNKIFKKMEIVQSMTFPNAISRFAVIDQRPGRVKLKEGNIICAGTVFTTEIVVGSFNNFHVNCTVGHDTKIGNFCSFLPGANISGNCSFGDNVFVGAGSVILQNLSICNDVVIGAGAVITKNIEEPGTYVGIPAKKIN